MLTVIACCSVLGLLDAAYNHRWHRRRLERQDRGPVARALEDAREAGYRAAVSDHQVRMLARALRRRAEVAAEEIAGRRGN